MNVAITPNGALLTPELPSQALVATVRDRLGKVLDAPVTWSSSAPDVIDVDGAGRVTALVPVGSAVITATAGTASGEVMVLAAVPAPGAVVVSDANVAGPLVAVDPAASFGVGFRYDVTLTGVQAPAVGELVMANGEQQVGGRVVAANGDTVTVEVVPLDELFAALEMSAKLDLRRAQFRIPSAVDEAFVVEQRADGSFSLTSRVGQGSAPLQQQSPLEFGVGRFKCEASFGAIQITLVAPQVTFNPALALDLRWDENVQKLVVSGTPTLEVEVTPELAATLSGELTCKLAVYEIYLPFPGPIGAVLGAMLPFGPGFTIQGELPIGGIGAKYSANASAEMRFGFECAPDCSTVAELDATVTGKIEPIWPTALSGVKVEAELSVFMFTDLKAGLRVDPEWQAEIATSQTGLVFSANVASEETQVADTGYKSEYDLKVSASAGSGVTFDRFLDLVSVDVATFGVSFDWPVAESPKATQLKADRDSFSVGDQLVFHLELDPNTLELPILGYNVAAVRIYRKNGSSLVQVAEAPGSADQSVFELAWVADVAGSVRGNFVAFVSTNLKNEPRLELGDVVPEPPGTASVSCERTETHEEEWREGDWTRTTAWEERRSLSFTLELVSTMEGAKRYTSTGGSISFSRTYDYSEVHPGQALGACTFNETIEDHSSATGSGSSPGAAGFYLDPSGFFSIDAYADDPLAVTTTGVWSAHYAFTSENDGCRSNVNDPYVDEDEEWVEIEVEGNAAPGEEHHFTATASDVSWDGTTTTTTTCTFNL